MRHVAALCVAVIISQLPVIYRPASGLSQTRPDVGSLVVPLGLQGHDSKVVPEAEAQLFAMLNEARQEHHLAPLVMNASLRGVARSHSHDMAVQGYIGHGSALGQSFIVRLSKVVPAGTFVGENIGAATTVEQIHGAFMHSRGHLENILGPAFSRVGIGVATAERVLMVTEDFAE
jgi:uncharacterized protein YkwD